MSGMLRSQPGFKGMIPDRAAGRGGGKSHRRYKHETEYVKRALGKRDRQAAKRDIADQARGC